MGPGGIGGRPGDQERQAGGSLQDRRRSRRGGVPHPLESGKPAGLPGGVPCPLRPEEGGMPGTLLLLAPSVQPKPHPQHLPGPFPALWVLSMGPAHHPNPTPA